jgi:hypothetical protein
LPLPLPLPLPFPPAAPDFDLALERSSGAPQAIEQ